MVNFRTVGYVVNSICMSFIDAGVVIKKGAMIIGEEGSHAIYEIYSLEGFEKWSKAIISDLRLLSLIPSINGVFDSCLKTLEAQKDLCYATLVFASTAEFVGEIRDDAGEFVGYKLKIPTIKEKKADGTVEENTDWVKVLYGIGNFFETGKFLQKYKIYDFPIFSQAANQFGAFKLFKWDGQDVTLGDIPVLNCCFDKPKDFFVFFAAAYTVRKTWNKLGKSDFFSAENIENLAKLIGNIGKMTLISSADKMARRKYLVSLAVLSVITDNASLIGLFLKRRKERESRLRDPT